MSWRSVLTAYYELGELVTCWLDGVSLYIIPKQMHGLFFLPFQRRWRTVCSVICWLSSVLVLNMLVVLPRLRCSIVVWLFPLSWQRLVCAHFFFTLKTYTRVLRFFRQPAILTIISATWRLVKPLINVKNTVCCKMFFTWCWILVFSTFTITNELMSFKFTVFPPPFFAMPFRVFDVLAFCRHFVSALIGSECLLIRACIWLFYQILPNLDTALRHYLEQNTAAVITHRFDARVFHTCRSKCHLSWKTMKEIFSQFENWVLN